MLKSSKSIGELIYYYRLVKNYSQSDLAKELNVTVSAVSSWERGVNKPGVDIALRLSDDMGITLDAFYKDKVKSIQEKKYSILEFVTFEKAYLKWQKIQMSDENTLQIGFYVWGLSVHKDFLQNALEVRFTAQDRPLKVHTIEVIDHPVSYTRFSPELKLMPLIQPKGYLVLYTLEFESFMDLTIEIEYQAEKVIFEVSSDLIEAIIKGISFDQNAPEFTLNFLESPTFSSVLKYFATVDDFNTLQSYLVNQYKRLSKHIEPRKPA